MSYDINDDPTPFIARMTVYAAEISRAIERTKNTDYAENFVVILQKLRDIEYSRDEDAINALNIMWMSSQVIDKLWHEVSYINYEAVRDYLAPELAKTLEYF